MDYSKMKKAQLTQEIEALQAKIAELEGAQTERKRAEEGIEQRNRELATLNAIATVVSQSLNLDEILNAGLDKVLELMHLNVGGIYLADPERRKLDLIVHRGISKELAHEIESVSVDEKTLEVAMAESKLRRFILSVTAAIKYRVELKRIMSATKKEGLSVASGVPVLLQAKEEILGLMIVASRVPRQYSAVEVQLLTFIGQQIAVAIENARLYGATQRELAERKQAEEALRESEERFRELVENANDTIYTHDLEGNFTSVNPAATRVYGYTTEEVLRLNIAHIFDPEYLPLAQQKIREKLEGSPGTGLYELLTHSKEGNPIWVEVSTRLLESKAQPVGVLGIARDITERKRAEEELQRSFEKLQRTLDETVNALASAVEMRDPYTAGHQRRVTRLAWAIANEMGLPKEQVEGLRMAGLIHDLGKITIPAEILSKPGRLSDLQHGLIQTHAQVGHEILKTVEFSWPVADIVLQHHERLDGSGYPQGLVGEEIMLEARILAVADVVEAMASHRPYRPLRGLDKALEEISQNGDVLYDPEVVDACLKLFTEKGFTFEQEFVLSNSAEPSA